ncbi:MAG: glutamine--fructose-6-phosphate transaminase (isomerizing), partial [Clostridia bacterium]|nr:glutamine--fructose-6-phosphate transaminase (isomerizing) [Clostridia bacterium]
MCGIVGYSGFQNAKNIVIDGLKTLEYRGYDSAGIAFGGEDISVFKTVGSVAQLEELIPDIYAHTAIGHTRWATHGKPDAINAHPHLSFDKNIAVVHNGVIENCDELHNELVTKGITFVSDTDSEIIAHLLALEDTSDMLGAVERVGKRLKGAATFLAVKRGEDAIYVRRKNASVAVGIGDNESFVASDTLAISKYTLKTVIMKDGECAVLRGGSVEFFKDGKPIQKQPVRIRRTPPKPCACHMRSEIDEIPAALERTLASAERTLDDDFIDELRNAKRVYLVGCGTAYHAGLYGKEVLETALHVPCDAIVASEFDRVRFLDKHCAVILITQSGETADTLYALDICKAKGAHTLAITNVTHSSITFSADRTLLIDAGAEVAVAATKSYNCQLFALYLIAKRIDGTDLTLDEFARLTSAIRTVSTCDLYEERIKRANLFFVGKGIDSITAQEAALKFKEITYKMTDSYSSGELKHGAIALIDDKSTVVIIATSQEDKHRIEATVSELRSRGAYTVALSSVGDI